MTARNFGVQPRESEDDREIAARAFALLVGGPLVLIAIALLLLAVQ